MKQKKWRSFALLLTITIFTMLVMAYFGFRLKGFRPQNNVLWAESGTGLKFKRFSMAFTDSFFSAADPQSESHLTIECAIAPEFSKYPGFRFILLVHDGRDDHQLVLGQYGSQLMVLNDDDYGNRYKTPKIYVQLDEKVRQPALVTIVSRPSGTEFYLDGQLKKQNKELKLKYPGGGQQAKLVVGNNLIGNLPWTGSISGLALYDRALKVEKVLEHYRTWNRGNNFNEFKLDAPRLLYAFDEGRGNSVHNLMGPSLDLVIPVWMRALDLSILSWPKIAPSAVKGFFLDLVINLIGFIPLGILVTATLIRFKGFRGHTLLIAVVLFAFCFSLIIEIVQAWVPSRDSSALDLIMNTSGSWVGSLIFVKVASGKGLELS